MSPGPLSCVSCPKTSLLEHTLHKNDEKRLQTSIFTMNSNWVRRHDFRCRLLSEGLRYGTPNLGPTASKVVNYALQSSKKQTGRLVGPKKLTKVSFEIASLSYLFFFGNKPTTLNFYLKDAIQPHVEIVCSATNVF